MQQCCTCAFHPSLTFVISVIIFHPQIYVQHNQWSFVYHDSESPSVSSPTFSIHAPFIYVHESHTSACGLFIILHPWPQTWGEGNGQVSPGLRMFVVPVTWEENVVFWQPGCSIFIVPLNKHMGTWWVGQYPVQRPVGARRWWSNQCPSNNQGVSSHWRFPLQLDRWHTFVTCSASS